MHRYRTAFMKCLKYVPSDKPCRLFSVVTFAILNASDRYEVRLYEKNL